MSKITIHISDGAGTASVEIESEVVGPFGVHLSYGTELVDGSDAWTVSHVASGYRVTPFYFSSSDSAKTFASVLACLPLDWLSATVMKDLDQYSRTDLRQVVYGASALIGGFLVESSLDSPVGTA